MAANRRCANALLVIRARFERWPCALAVSYDGGTPARRFGHDPFSFPQHKRNDAATVAVAAQGPRAASSESVPPILIGRAPYW
jgi:hypothetical protein